MALPAGHAQGYQQCFDDFTTDVYAAVGSAGAGEHPTFSDGMRAARVTDAVLTSAATGGWVTVG